MRGASLASAAVLGASLVLAAATFALVTELLRNAGATGPEAEIARLDREIAAQADALAGLRRETRRLADAQEALRAAQPAPAASTTPPEAAPPAADVYEGEGAPPATEELVQQMQLAAARFNRGIERPRPETLRALVGEPRTSYGQDCQPVTNPRMVDRLETREIAGFRVTMLRPALDSLATVMKRLDTEEPEIYRAIGTAGGLCARFVRGSDRVVSSHAWGLAIDLTLTGDLDRMGDDSTQFGLVVLAEFFNDAGWYWGAGYGREDSMHFEVGEAMLRQWVADGEL
ncbi:M15 family metallopeptidase [Amaricoccus sp.]|uniref:M15 family metallopeptidase n=1 Tax=Amaricoccus sp. TaxID=1872485 RepID=UPI001B4A4521|nr:M15 family metallopeptidase [Amaricoccus sp.]MBP7241721.1 M15 family metallopeptidase [Amaricoccus sp.]